MQRERIVELDRSHVWHPYTAMGPYRTESDPIVVERALGSRLFDVNGRSYIDANSSWWCASLGHGHPRLVAALAERERSGARLGFNTKILIEMGEEVGSAGLRELCMRHKQGLLHADLLIASDGPRIAPERPTLFLGARGGHWICSPVSRRVTIPRRPSPPPVIFLKVIWPS